MSLTTGTDLLSVAVVVAIFSIFVVTLVRAHQLYQERREVFEHFNMALEFAEETRDRVAGWNSASLKTWLDAQARIWAREGLSFRVEIRDFQGVLLFEHGQRPDQLAPHLSRPAGAALPVVFDQNGLRAEPCGLAVRVWRF